MSQQKLLLKFFKTSAISILHTLLHNPERYLGKSYLAIVQTSGEILAVAIRTPPQKLILSKAQNMDALQLIAQDLRQEQLPGSIGLAKEAEIFSQTWRSLTGQFYQRSVVMKIYQLTAVQRVSTTRGYLRLATESDRSKKISIHPAKGATPDSYLFYPFQMGGLFPPC